MVGPYILTAIGHPQEQKRLYPDVQGAASHNRAVGSSFFASNALTQTSHAHPLPFVHFLSRAMQLSPHALPFEQRLQHDSA